MFKKKMSSACFVSVVIPVQNESIHLKKTLAALSAQINFSGEIFRKDYFEVIVLTNNCSDNSFEIARQFQLENKSFNLHIADLNTSKKNANSGFVRHLLMEKAYERLTANNKKGGIILTTDGDTRVAKNWVAANVLEIMSGAEAVGGRILFDSAEFAEMNSAAKQFYLMDENYRLLSAELESYLDFTPHDAFPKHHQHFNGSFAVTTDAYKKAGGVPDVRCLEDVALYQSLLRVDAKFRHSPSVEVYTSARKIGRTEAGLSTQINDWINLGEKGEDFLVESAETLENRFEFHGKLRVLWKNLQAGFKPKDVAIKKLADSFNCSVEMLKCELFISRTFGLLLENIYKLKGESEQAEQNTGLVSVEKAAQDLEKKLEKFRRKKKSPLPPQIKIFSNGNADGSSVRLQNRSVANS